MMDCELYPFFCIHLATDLNLRRRFDAWVRSLDFYAGHDLLYLSPSGTIPDVAVIKKGMKRENPFKEKRVFDSTSFPDKSKLEDGSDAEVEDDLPTNKRDLAEMEG